MENAQLCVLLLFCAHCCRIMYKPTSFLDRLRQQAAPDYIAANIITLSLTILKRELLAKGGMSHLLDLFRLYFLDN